MSKRIRVKKYIFRIVCVCVLFMLVIFSREETVNGQKWIVTFINNKYVCGVICSIFAIIIVFIVQNIYSKKRIVNDFRCDEVLWVVNYAVNKFCVLYEECDDFVDKNQKSLRVKIYKDNDYDVMEVYKMITFYNNDILIDTVRTYLFSNLDFELLSLVNHIKNRRPTLMKSSKKLKDHSDESIDSFIYELNCMVKYWYELIDYLGYSNKKQNAIMNLYRERYPIYEEIDLPVKERKKHYKEIVIEYRKNRVKLLFERFTKGH